MMGGNGLGCISPNPLLKKCLSSVIEKDGKMKQSEHCGQRASESDTSSNRHIDSPLNQYRTRNVTSHHIMTMNLFRLAGDMSHVFSIVVLLLRLRVVKNAAG
jgi:hypothetical protein